MANPGDDPFDVSPQRTVQFTEDIDPGASILADDGGLVEWVRDELSDDLRVVGAYDESTFELLYAAPVVSEEYTEDEIAATGDEFALSDVRGDPYQEELYHLGDLSYDVQGFEEGQVIRIPFPDDRGLVVSVEASTSVLLPEFVDDLIDRHEVEFR